MGFSQTLSITVIFGICIEDPNIIKSLLKDIKPIKAKLDKISFFKSNEGYEPLITKVKSPELEDLHKKIKKMLNVESTHNEYKPHCTIAYVKEGEAMKFAGDTYFDGIKLVFDEVVFINNNKEETTIKLK